MDKKTKLIFIGLIAALLFVSSFLVFSEKLRSDAVKDSSDLKKMNVSLGNELDKIKSDVRNYQSSISSMNKQLNDAVADNRELATRLEITSRDREELIQRLKEKQSQAQAAPQMQEAPQTTDAYWAGILKAKKDLELQLGSIRDEFKGVQIANEELQRKNSSLSLEIDGLKRAKDDLKRQFDYNQKMLDSIAQDLVRERSDRMRVEDSYKVIKSENAVLRRQLNSLNNRKVELEKKMQKIQEDKTAIEEKVSSMQTMLTEKITQINEFKQQLDGIRQDVSLAAKSSEQKKEKDSVELPAIVVHSKIEAPTVKQEPVVVSPQGKILEVNRDNGNNFVIIDLGESSGLKSGDIMQVYRDNSPIAVIEVIQVRANIAACDINKELTPVRNGDFVK